MQYIERENMPEDHLYYRTSSIIYRKYLESSKLGIIETGEKQFGWLKNILGIFNVAKFERIDTEPSIEKLKKKVLNIDLLFGFHIKDKTFQNDGKIFG